MSEPVRGASRRSVASVTQALCCGPFVPLGTWQPDVINECKLCKFGYSCISRKHHCRRCGALVCAACSQRQKCCNVRLCVRCVANEREQGGFDCRPRDPLRRNTGTFSSFAPTSMEPRNIGTTPGQFPSSSVSTRGSMVDVGTLMTTPVSTFRTAGLKVMSALKSQRERKAVNEVLLFRRALRALHNADEGLFGVQSDDEMSVTDREEDCEDPEMADGEEHHDKADFVASAVGAVIQAESGESVPVCSRKGYDCPSEHRLHEILAMCRRGEAPPRDEAIALIVAVQRHLDELPNVVHVDVPAHGRLVVVGDIHGQLKDLNTVLEAHGGPSADSVFLFNGDFVDRGCEGVEVLLALFCLQLLLPKSVHLNRGNHEDDFVNRRYGFKKECKTKFKDDRVYEYARECFLRLPLVYIVSNKIAVIHAGLPKEPGVTLAEINAIDRRTPPQLGLPKEEQMKLTREELLYQALLWSDPKDLNDGSDWQDSARGAGCMFGAGLVGSFLKGNHLNRLVRSHEVCSAGYATHHGGRTVTVFSASNYGGSDDNQGCHLVIHPSLEVEYVQHNVMPDFDPIRLRTSVRNLHALEAHAASSSGSDDSPIWATSAKQECLSLLRQIIFVKRQELLREFEAADIMRRGTITLKEWVAVMHAVVHRELPWYMLSHYLIAREKTNRVAYMPFLERFQNGLARCWMMQWAGKVRPFVAERLAGIADKHNGRLSYSELCKAMRTELPGLKESSVYYMLASFGCDGCRSEALREAAAESANQPPCVLDLWVLASFRKGDFRQFLQDWRQVQESKKSAAQSGHLVSLSHKDFVELGMQGCHQVGKAARSRWEATAVGLDPGKTGQVHFPAVSAAVEVLGAEWWRATQVLDILETSARACVGLQDIFELLDADGDNFISKQDFQTSAAQLVGHRLTEMQMGLIFDSLDADGTGRISREELTTGLEVNDLWDIAETSPSGVSLRKITSHWSFV